MAECRIFNATISQCDCDLAVDHRHLTLDDGGRVTVELSPALEVRELTPGTIYLGPPLI